MVDDTRPCWACSAPLTKRQGKGRWPRYCSGRCKWKASKRPVQRRSVNCLTCSAHIEVGLRTGPAPRYCSPQCKASARRTREGTGPSRPVLPLVTMHCRRCGLPFVTKDVARKYCSQRCNAADTRRGAQPSCDAEQRACQRCGVLFAARHTSMARYCSDTCRSSLRWARRREPRGHEIPVALRRAVYVRDARTCALCRKPLDFGKKAPHPMSPSIDHIIPRSRGGTDDILNLQAAHLLCNNRKNAYGAAQLRLV